MKKVGLLNIRNKIFICFLIPIAFMIIVGFVSYKNASEGMSAKFEDTSSQTVNMTVELLDEVCNNISSSAASYVMDAGFASYVLGMPGSDNIAKAQYWADAKSNLMAAQSANSYINNIHLVTKAIVPNISTATASKVDGVYDEYIAELKEKTGLESFFPKWVTSHDALDEALELKKAETFITYQVQDAHKMGYIVYDIKKSAMSEILKNVDFGEGSYVALIAPDGNEIALKSGSEELLDNTGIFTSQSFYEETVNSEELAGNLELTYEGTEYFCLYQKSEETGLMICAMIPLATIVGQAESIKSITVTLVILATIFSLLIGTFIAGGIQRNMKNISKKLDEVAKGNLTVRVDAKGRDEFQALAKSATNMVANNKNLVVKLSGTALQLQSSAKSVNDASSDISNCSSEITQAIDEISQGVDKQAEHALECVNITNNLSEKIKNITSDITVIEKLITETETLIEKGTGIVNNLAKRAKETSELTATVGKNILKLQDETDSINEFVDTIGAIAKKTNLLSLNASIEAARAGEAGRGFAVVADEIRVLADNSASASSEISSRVQHIDSQTSGSVDAANNAAQMVGKQQEAVDAVIDIFNQINEQMKTLIVALSKISESALAADSQRQETVDAVDNISAIIEQTAASSTLVRNMTNNLLSSVDRLGATADNLDENMNGLKTEIAAFNVE